MDDHDIKSKRKDLLGLLSRNDGMTEILTNVTNQILEAQCTEQFQAKPYDQFDRDGRI